jgi:hypothetical protein
MEGRKRIHLSNLKLNVMIVAEIWIVAILTTQKRKIIEAALLSTREDYPMYPVPHILTTGPHLTTTDLVLLRLIFLGQNTVRWLIDH